MIRYIQTEGSMRCDFLKDEIQKAQSQTILKKKKKKWEASKGIFKRAKEMHMKWKDGKITKEEYE